jgi:prophage antirepressor-like protein
MASTGLQPTTALTFRATGSKPWLVHVFAKGGRKWIVASDVCRILGIRTDAVPKLIPEQERGRATVLSKGSVESVTIVTAAGFNLLIAQSSKPIAKTLHEWMVGEALPPVGKAAPPTRTVEGQGKLF